MENNAPTTTAVSAKRDLRWLWRACWVVLLLVTVWGVYLVVTGRPALYSPPEVMRNRGQYVALMNPPRLTVAAPTNTAAAPVITTTTNGGKVRIEYPYLSSGAPAEVIGFRVQQVEAGEMVQLGGTTVQLRRIGHVWLPPKTNATSHYLGNVPATFYGPDLQLLSDAAVAQALPERWQRNADCRDNVNGYRFDVEIKGGSWKVLGANLYDARTQILLTMGSSSRTPVEGYQVNLEPYLWHQAPVELVLEVATGPVESVEIPVQTGASFDIGPCRYHLIYAGSKLSGNYYSSGSNGKTGYVELAPPPAHQRNQKESVLIFIGQPQAAHTAFELEFLDAQGQPLPTAGGGTSGGRLIQGVTAELADIKTIRVRKWTTGHRLFIRLPGLPGLPPENQKVDNLFRVRIPMLRFDREHEQEEFIKRVVQLELASLPHTNLPPGTYPRWFTNATVMEVLEDYAQVRGVPGQLYVNQEKLMIERGQRPWPLEVQEKLVKLWEKLRGP